MLQSSIEDKTQYVLARRFCARQMHKSDNTPSWFQRRENSWRVKSVPCEAVIVLQSQSRPKLRVQTGCLNVRTA